MADISVMNKSNEGNGLSGVILTPNSACTPTSLPEAASQPFGYQNIRNDDVIDLVSLDDDDLEQIDTFYLQTLNSTVTQSLDTKQCAPTNSDSQQSLPNTSPISHPVLQDEKENSEENDDSDDIIEIIDLADDTESVKSLDDQSSDESENMYVCFCFFTFSNSYCCPICLEKPRSPISTMCGHIFCEMCIRRLFWVRIVEQDVMCRMITTLGNARCVRVVCYPARFKKFIFDLFVGKG